MTQFEQKDIDHKNRGADLAKFLFDPNTLFFRTYPGGETYLVANPDIQRNIHKELDAFILRNYPYFQQGGFIEASTGKATCRLQMAYDELCVNGARSLSCILAKDVNEGMLASIARYERISQQGNIFRMELEVSGTGKTLVAEAIRLSENLWNASIEIPTISNDMAEVVKNYVVNLNGENIPVGVIFLDGITHIAVNQEVLPFPYEESEYKKLTIELSSILGIADKPVIGCLWYEKIRDLVVINPVVYLRESDQIILETACGSGSISVSLYEARKNKIENFRYEFFPPSGIKAVAEGRIENGIIENLRVGGQVELKGMIKH